MADQEDDLEPESTGEPVVKQGPVAVLTQVEKPTSSTLSAYR